MKYAVALMNFFDNVNEITVVDADDPITAMIEGARTLMAASDEDEFLNPFLEDIPPAAGYGKRMEEIQEAFFNADNCISQPMPV